MRRLLFGSGVTSALIWMSVYLLTLGVATGIGFHLIAVQRKEGCENRNASTEDAVHVLAKALVKQANPDTDPARIRGFLDGLDQDLAAIAIDC